MPLSATEHAAGGGASHPASPCGRNGASPGAVNRAVMPSDAAQSSPARTPANGPCPWNAPSDSTGRPNEAKRAGSPFALMATGRTSSADHRRQHSPVAYGHSGLSPPPIRAPRRRPGQGGGAVHGHRRWGGASNGTRTRDIQDHNLALYQLSYARHPGAGV